VAETSANGMPLNEKQAEGATRALAGCMHGPERARQRNNETVLLCGELQKLRESGVQELQIGLHIHAHAYAHAHANARAHVHTREQSATAKGCTLSRNNKKQHDKNNSNKCH
jgi:hypothetical protein